jgi:multisubunit Na+/H+ antiporter MnhB subunit
MYVFGTFVLFALGIMALTMFAERFYTRARELRAVVAVGLGIGLAWLAGFNLWTQWHLPLRYDWVGTTLTGLALGGWAVLSHAVLGLFAGIYRKVSDEAEALEHQRPEIRPAA